MKFMAEWLFAKSGTMAGGAGEATVLATTDGSTVPT
jgi:hypothetical protein